jgi:hypothetical protein
MALADAHQSAGAHEFRLPTLIPEDDLAHRAAPFPRPGQTTHSSACWPYTENRMIYLAAFPYTGSRRIRATPVKSVRVRR